MCYYMECERCPRMILYYVSVSHCAFRPSQVALGRWFPHSRFDILLSHFIEKRSSSDSTHVDVDETDIFRRARQQPNYLSCLCSISACTSVNSLIERGYQEKRKRMALLTYVLLPSSDYRRLLLSLASWNHPMWKG